MVFGAVLILCALCFVEFLGVVLFMGMRWHI